MSFTVKGTSDHSSILPLMQRSTVSGHRKRSQAIHVKNKSNGVPKNIFSESAPPHPSIPSRRELPNAQSISPTEILKLVGETGVSLRASIGQLVALAKAVDFAQPEYCQLFKVVAEAMDLPTPFINNESSIDFVQKSSYNDEVILSRAIELCKTHQLSVTVTLPVMLRCKNLLLSCLKLIKRDFSPNPQEFLTDFDKLNIDKIIQINISNNLRVNGHQLVRLLIGTGFLLEGVFYNPQTIMEKIQFHRKLLQNEKPVIADADAYFLEALISMDVRGDSPLPPDRTTQILKTLEVLSAYSAPLISEGKLESPCIEDYCLASLLKHHPDYFGDNPLDKAVVRYRDALQLEFPDLDRTKLAEKVTSLLGSFQNIPEMEPAQLISFVNNDLKELDPKSPLYITLRVELNSLNLTELKDDSQCQILSARLEELRSLFSKYAFSIPYIYRSKINRPLNTTYPHDNNEQLQQIIDKQIDFLLLIDPGITQFKILMLITKYIQRSIDLNRCLKISDKEEKIHEWLGQGDLIYYWSPIVADTPITASAYILFNTARENTPLLSHHDAIEQSRFFLLKKHPELCRHSTEQLNHTLWALYKSWWYCSQRCQQKSPIIAAIEWVCIETLSQASTTKHAQALRQAEESFNRQFPRLFFESIHAESFLYNTLHSSRQTLQVPAKEIESLSIESPPAISAATE